MTRPVSVIIVTRDRIDSLRQCVDSVLPQLSEQDQIVIIAGDEESCPPELLRSCDSDPDISLGHCHDPNISRARNMGLDLAHNDLVLFIDDDAIAHADWVESYRNAFHSHTLACIAGGDVLDARTSPMSFEFRSGLIHPSGRQISLRKNPGEPIPRGYQTSVKGCNFGILRSRSPIEVRFDEFFRFAFDETDLLVSMLEAGGVAVHVPEAIVDHHHAPGIYRSSTPMDRDWRTEFASHTMFMRKHTTGVDRVMGWGVIVARLVRHASRGVGCASRARCGVRQSALAITDAIRGVSSAATRSLDNA